MSDDNVSEPGAVTMGSATKQLMLDRGCETVLPCLLDKPKLRIDPVATARGSDTANGNM